MYGFAFIHALGAHLALIFLVACYTMHLRINTLNSNHIRMQIPIKRNDNARHYVYGVHRIRSQLNVRDRQGEERANNVKEWKLKSEAKYERVHKLSRIRNTHQNNAERSPRKPNTRNACNGDWLWLVSVYCVRALNAFLSVQNE